MTQILIEQTRHSDPSNHKVAAIFVSHTQSGQISYKVASLVRKYYSQMPNKQVGWEKVQVGWRVNTFFCLCVGSFCMLPYSHFFHPTSLLASKSSTFLFNLMILICMQSKPLWYFVTKNCSELSKFLQILGLQLSTSKVFLNH